MTIEKTRQLLGEKISHLTDDQILNLIEKTDKALDGMFKIAVKKAFEKQNGNVVI